MPTKVNPLLAASIALVLLACGDRFAPAADAAKKPADAAACERSWKVVRTVPHDASHFTQGLAILDGVLFESTGLYGRSAVYREDLRTGTVLDSRALPSNGFGEGLTRVGSRLFQVTWQEQTGRVYGLDLSPIGVFRYRGEGWGLATVPTLAGERLVLSDGTSRLRFLDPDSFEETGSVEVMDRGRPVTMINELEFVRGEILANLWQTDRVDAIDPYSGAVVGWYDLAELKTRFDPPPGFDPREHVLNGLALDEATGHVYATGKQWPALFELELGGCRGHASR